MANKKKDQVIVRSIEDFDRLAPPTPPVDDAPYQVEDPEALGRRLGLEILRQAFAPLREEKRSRRRSRPEGTVPA
ncbi:MAG TPA: hypothetical protein VGM94_01570 [Galbitalea sp.]